MVKLVDSDFLNGLGYKEGTYKPALEKIIKVSEKSITVCVMLFSRQRYWERAVPVYYVNGLPQMIDATFANYFPEVEKYLPTEDGLPPLNAAVWAWDTKLKLKYDLV
jgi:leucyl-tRNA synthetase